MSKESTKTAKQAGKFGIVGIMNTVVDLGIYNVLSQVFGVYVVAANVISVSVAILNSFFWNKVWTFEDKSNKDFLVKFAKFIVFSLVGLGIQTVVVWFLATKWTASGQWAFSIVDLLGLEKIFNQTFVINNWAKVWGIGFALIWNFFAYKKWTFNK